MQALDRSLQWATSHVAVPWPGLGEIIQPGPGHLVMMLGAPGVGKSALSLYWGLNVGGPAVIVSQDTDLTTQAARTCAAFTGVSMETVKQDIPRWQSYLRANVRQLPLMYDHPIKSSDVSDLVYAAEEYYGETPAVVVIDVLKNVVAEKSYEGYITAIEDLHRAARRHGTCIFVLHHVNRQGRNASGTKPVRLDDGQYGGEGDAEIVLGLWTPKWQEDPINPGQWIPLLDPTLRVSVLKNRFGRKDPEGRDVYVDLRVDYDRMVIQ